MSTMMNGLNGTKTDVILLCNICTQIQTPMGIAPLPTHDIIWLRKRRKIFMLTRASSSARAHDEEEKRWEKSINLKCREKHTASVRDDDESKLQPAAQHKELSVAADEFDSRTRFCSSKDFGRCGSSTSFVESRHRRTPEFSTLRIKREWSVKKNLNIDRRKWKGEKYGNLKILYQLTITYFLDYSNDVAAVHMMLTSQWTNTTWYMYAMVRAPEFTILLNNV